MGDSDSESDREKNSVHSSDEGEDAPDGRTMTGSGGKDDGTEGIRATLASRLQLGSDDDQKLPHVLDSVDFEWSTSGRAGPRRSSPWLGQEYLLQQEFLTSAHLAPDYMTICRNIIFQSQLQYLISGGGQGERKVYNEDVSQVFPPQSPAILLARKRALSRKILPNSLPLLRQTAPREGASLEALHAEHRHLGARGRHR